MISSEALLILFACAAEAAVSYIRNVVVNRDSVLNENPLTKPITGVKRYGFIFIRIICYFTEDMSLIVAVIIITVNNSHCIIHLKSEFKAESASRIQL